MSQADNSPPEESESEPALPATPSHGGARAVLDQMGGVSGLIYSSLPVVVFVPVSTLFGLMPAIGAALGLALATPQNAAPASNAPAEDPAEVLDEETASASHR